MEPLELPVLIFDGNCGLCCRLASWIGTHFQEPVSLLASQAIDPAAAEALGLDERRLRASLWWVESPSHACKAHRAGGKALLATDLWWRQAGWLCLVPPASWVAAALYKVVAVSRTRLPDAACSAGHRE